MNVFEFTLPMFSTNVTQIFKHLLKIGHKVHKKRNSTQKREDINTIKCIESI